MKGSEFVFDYVHLLYFKYNKKNPNCRGSCIDPPDWIRMKKATIETLINAFNTLQQSS